MDQKIQDILQQAIDYHTLGAAAYIKKYKDASRSARTIEDPSTGQLKVVPGWVPTARALLAAIEFEKLNKKEEHGTSAGSTGNIQGS